MPEQTTQPKQTNVFKSSRQTAEWMYLHRSDSFVWVRQGFSERNLFLEIISWYFFQWFLFKLVSMPALVCLK